MNKQGVDHLLKTALIQGDEAAFDIVFRMYYPKIKFFAARLCGDKAEAENIAQDIFMQLWIRRNQLIEIQNLENYIYVMTKNASFEIIRRSLQRQRIVQETASEEPDDNIIDNELHYKELMDIVKEEIERMPAQRRRIFLMSRREGLSNEQIAQELGLSKRTVETHISLALQQLRHLMPLLELLTLTLMLTREQQF